MGRTKHRQIQAGKRVPRSLNHSRPNEGVGHEAMVRSKYVYWCISHQQFVEPSVRRKLRDQLHCKIVKLNLTLLLRVDFYIFSTWANSEHSSRRDSLVDRIQN